MNTKMSLIAAGLLTTGLLVGPATAQTAAPAPAPDATGWMTQEKPGVWRAFKLKGLDVYNNGNQKIGDVEEILIDASGNAQAAVIGVGGFLGMGEHSVAVPFKDLQFVDKERHVLNRPANTAADTTTTATTKAASRGAEPYPDHAVLNMTKDQLKAAPQFHFAK